MKRILIVLLITACASVGLAAQEKATGEKKEKKGKAAAAKPERWSGYIQRQNKDQSTLTVRKGNIERTVIYDGSTQWTKLNKPAQASDFKEGSRVIVLGKYDEKGRLIASRIDLRADKFPF